MSDYAGLVCIRALSRAVRRRPHCELLRCSGIHLDESALMTELRRDGAHLNNDNDLPDQTNHQQRALSCSLLRLFSPSTLCSSTFSSPTFTFSTQFWGVYPLTFSTLSRLRSLSPSSLLLSNCHLPLAIRVIQIARVSLCHRRRVGRDKREKGREGMMGE